ncbi:MAG: type II toxin-antitoxin system VapC family toxin [Verrucomicrobia bacterium]|nr:MAG: type II toxin-antitoxin system VapC family toxin [Verrucomicrobiota bacterium]
MTIAIDTTVLVAAMVSSETHHQACSRLMDRGGVGLYAHGLSEAFSTLTGGRMLFRMKAGEFVELIEEDYVPALTILTLTPTEMLRGMRECEARGVRGAAIFDFHHLAAARKAKATRLYTLNVTHFRAFHRAGDPEIIHP